MRSALSLTAVVLLLLAPGSGAQDRQCQSDEQTLRAAAHEYWSAHNRQDVAALAKLLDDELLFISESGSVLTKEQVLAQFRTPNATIMFESAEQPEDVRARFVGDMGILSFTKRWSFTHKPSDATFGATSRMTEAFVCRRGVWKVLLFQETMVADPNRQIFRPAIEHFDQYVGAYRFGADGSGGQITVTRKGDKLYESWGNDRPVEIFPGKFDTFFTPGFPVLERFVRDTRGRVVGILYAMGDTEVEAKRIN
jgi:ketosteroid isomerase-like protein